MLQFASAHFARDADAAPPQTAKFSGKHSRLDKDDEIEGDLTAAMMFKKHHNERTFLNGSLKVQTLPSRIVGRAPSMAAINFKRDALYGAHSARRSDRATHRCKSSMALVFATPIPK